MGGKEGGVVGLTFCIDPNVEENNKNCFEDVINDCQLSKDRS